MRLTELELEALLRKGIVTINQGSGQQAKEQPARPYGQKSEIRHCAFCNGEFKFYPNRIKYGQKGMYCSPVCAGKAKTKTRPPKKEIQKKELNKCLNCDNKVKEHKKKYCSHACYNAHKIANGVSKTVKIKCLNCGKEIDKLKSQIKVGYGKFCSFSCSSIHRIKQTPDKQYGNSKGGKRADLENRYFRSRWEANFARYLNWLIKVGYIAKWEYEPETFYFEGLRHGTVSYTPDFKIYPVKDTPYFVEVKGYMDPKSKTKLVRMRKYYPTVRVDLLDNKGYRALAKKYKSIIPNWETNPKKKL